MSPRLSVSGELSEQRGAAEGVKPTSGAAIERAKRKGAADPDIKTEANRQRKMRRKKAKQMKTAQSSKGNDDEQNDKQKKNDESDSGESEDLALKCLVSFASALISK